MREEPTTPVDRRRDRQHLQDRHLQRAQFDRHVGEPVRVPRLRPGDTVRFVSPASAGTLQVAPAVE